MEVLRGDQPANFSMKPQKIPAKPAKVHENPSETENYEDFEKMSSLNMEPTKVALIKAEIELYSNLENEEFSLSNAKVSMPSFTIPFDDLICYMHFPKHNRNENFKLPEQPKLTGEDFNNNLVMPSEINSPALFWFHTSKTDVLVSALQNKMKEAYSRLKKDDLKIAKESLKEGLIVYAYHPSFDQWFRARVNKVHENNRCHIFYIDYGNNLFFKKNC